MERTVKKMNRQYARVAVTLEKPAKAEMEQKGNKYDCTPEDIQEKYELK